MIDVTKLNPGGKVVFGAIVTVADVDSGEDLSDLVEWSKFSGAAWDHEARGFYYSRYDEPDDDEANALARRVDVVLSCAPTFEERLRANRAAVRAGVARVLAKPFGLSEFVEAVRELTG